MLILRHVLQIHRFSLFVHEAEGLFEYTLDDDGSTLDVVIFLSPFASGSLLLMLLLPSAAAGTSPSRAAISHTLL